MRLKSPFIMIEMAKNFVLTAHKSKKIAVMKFA